MMKMTIVRSTILIFLICILTGCPEDAPRAATDTPGVRGTAEFPSAGFSDLYEKIPVDLPDAYQGTDYTLPVNLANVRFADEYVFSSGQESLLKENGFMIKPSDWAEFFQVYESVFYDDLPVFITTDSVFHIYHLLFDKLLRDLETEELYPAIQSLTSALVDAAADQYEEAKGTELEEDALTVLGFFAVAQQLIEQRPPEIPADAAEVVSNELQLIEQHSGVFKSPLFDFNEDYSQYVPRGHYTKSNLLKRYFRTLMWYGHIHFNIGREDAARQALLINRLIYTTKVDDKPATEVWATVYDPTVFFVGKSDDLSIRDLIPIMVDTFGDAPSMSQFTDKKLMDEFTDSVKELPPPLIHSVLMFDKAERSLGFRFMGQRFVVDAYIFENLMDDSVKGRWPPMGLDVFAANGHEEAYMILDELGSTGYEKYDDQLDMLQDKLGGLDEDMWTQNLYWDWIYSLRTLIEPKTDAFPRFMQTQAWARKDLHTALGSWTELKHDTILYAKQAMAQGGNGEEEIPEIVRGYVEPNPEAFAELISLTRMTRAGLDRLGVLPESMTWHLDEMDKELVFLLDITERELAGEKISDQEYDRIKLYGDWLEWRTMAAADAPGGYFTQKDHAALIADVATNAYNGEVLEEAIGPIYEIFVIVPDGVGGLQVTRGGAYSYYEFTWPMDDRLTDEKWRQMLRRGAQPDRPVWTKEFISE